MPDAPLAPEHIEWLRDYVARNGNNPEHTLTGIQARHWGRFLATLDARDAEIERLRIRWEKRAMPDDTNRRVAEACGFNCRTEFGELFVFRLAKSGTMAWTAFDPQHSASDAVIAAEKFGLFTMRGNIDSQEGAVWMDLFFEDGKWETVTSRGDVLGSGTFCEVICSAIIRLSGESTAAAG